MHPNDSESFTGGIGGPSDPALVEGGQGRGGEEPIRDANIVGLVVLAALGLLVVILIGAYGPAWLVANSAALPLFAWGLDAELSDECAVDGCGRGALTDGLCFHHACEMQEVDETVEVAS